MLKLLNLLNAIFLKILTNIMCILILSIIKDVIYKCIQVEMGKLSINVRNIFICKQQKC